MCLPLAFVACLGIAGCTRHEYVIDMEPDGPAVKRTTRINWKRDSDSDAPRDKTQKNPAFREAVRRLAKAYGVKPPASPGTTFTASGRFTLRLPDDVGGSGRFIRWESNLGSVAVYAERFRGNDDLYGALQDTSAAVDQVVDLVIGWVENEARREAGWTEFRAFLDGPFRRDLHNLALLSWSLNFLPTEPPTVVVFEPPKCERRKASAENQVLAEVAMRGAQYLAERGYFAVEDVPAIVRALNAHKPAWLLQVVRTSLASRLRPISPKLDVEKLAFLRTPELLMESWQRYVIGTEYFRKRHDAVLAAMIRKAERGKDAPAPGATSYSDQDVASQMVFDLLVKAFASFFRKAFEDFDELHLRLRAPRAPLWTNGRWIDARKTIEWKEKVSMAVGVGEFPTFCFAIWTEPDAEAQSRLFGRTAVDDQQLIEYCLWHSGLTSGERKEWDDFVKTLRNDPKSRQKLTAFRFSREPITVPTGDLVAAPAVKILEAELAAKRD